MGGWRQMPCPQIDRADPLLAKIVHTELWPGVPLVTCVP
jgi:hypothetical protein